MPSGDTQSLEKHEVISARPYLTLSKAKMFVTILETTMQSLDSLCHLRLNIKCSNLHWRKRHAWRNPAVSLNFIDICLRWENMIPSCQWSCIHDKISADHKGAGIALKAISLCLHHHWSSQWEKDRETTLRDNLYIETCRGAMSTYCEILVCKGNRSQYLTMASVIKWTNVFVPIEIYDLLWGAQTRSWETQCKEGIQLRCLSQRNKPSTMSPASHNLHNWT